jgi:hypothetical protein
MLFLKSIHESKKSKLRRFYLKKNSDKSLKTGIKLSIKLNYFPKKVFKIQKY